ncbi:MAG: AAA family ATPase [bacterium]|nr:AAA family ATPase [bacterium]
MKLIIINGPCGIGKSTLAGSMHATMPLSFLFDIDAQMRFISHYREYREERREITLALADAVIDALLRLGRDIVVDKMIFDPSIIDSYYGIAKKYGADVHEIILWAPKEVVMKRADERGWRKDGLLTPEKCEMFWHKIDELKNQRPNAIVLDAEHQSPEEMLAQVQKLMRAT